MNKTVIAILFCIFLYACSTGIIEGTNLASEDLDFFQKINVLDSEETIILFSSQSNHQQSGNFISDKRLASYWIDEKSKSINSAFYSEIDSLWTNDLSNALTYASYILVIKKDGTNFQVYVDDTPEKTAYFFETAQNEWEKWK